MTGDGTAGDGATQVDARPYRLIVACVSLAILVVVLFSGVAVGLGSRTEGGGYFGRGDQVAMVLLGVLVAGGVLLLARARVVADADRIQVRNPIGRYDLPWELVRGVRFDDDSPWAALDLVDDETVALMAVQAVDKERAVAVIRQLRQLHRSHQETRTAEGEPGQG